MIKISKGLLNEVRQGNLSCLTLDTVSNINNYVLTMLKSTDISVNNLEAIKYILEISNILYNNTDRNMLVLEDGVYDLLLELYKKYDSNFQVGAEPIFFEESNNESSRKSKSSIIKFVDRNKIDDMLYTDDIFYHNNVNRKDILKSPISFGNELIVSKRVTNTKHSYPKLVGTLDKCKFVLNSQAKERGVFEDSNVTVLERDFFKKHIDSGILDPKREFYMVAELKYDGISVEADVANTIISARTRGDANESIAADLTPILEGYRFRHAPNVDQFGMKFEAIMTYNDLARYNISKGKEYKNCRTAISGLISSSDARKYMEYITLVPLATSLDEVDRLTEIEFMNKYYNSGEKLRYSVLHGNYINMLFQIKMFVEEAEYLRDYMGFMYDGVVVSYIEPDLIDTLGRVNSVNKYSMAIKFNPVKKQAIFTKYEYTVGQNGTITPMIYYTPVEFFGTTHDKSTGHSYDRFKTLSLRKGDILDIEYVNDVMPYVSKPDNSNNLNNPNPLEEFPTECPSCGSKLEISKSEKTVLCVNMDCKERNIARIVSMLQKLNIKDFSSSYLSQIGKYSLSEIMNLTLEEVKFLGDLTSTKFIERMNELKSKPIYDYNIIGSLGFTGIGRTKWKLIFAKYTLDEILVLNHDQLKEALLSIKGIGLNTIETIINEFDFFRKDIEEIRNMPNVMNSKGKNFGKSIRFTGFRDDSLVNMLNDMGHDANGNSGVTKSTDILLIPYNGFTSSKTSKVNKNNGYNTIIVPVNDFKSNLNKYL